MLDCDLIAFIITYSLCAIYSICYMINKYKTKRIRRKAQMKNRKYNYMYSHATTRNEKM